METKSQHIFSINIAGRQPSSHDTSGRPLTLGYVGIDLRWLRPLIKEESKGQAEIIENQAHMKYAIDHCMNLTMSAVWKENQYHAWIHSTQIELRHLCNYIGILWNNQLKKNIKIELKWQCSCLQTKEFSAFGQYG